MGKLNSSHAVYCGSFDPLTLGHLDLIRRGASLFERLTIGIGINPDKRPLFTASERIELIQAAVADLANVNVEAFEGLTVDFARGQHAGVLLRGVRSGADVESERTMSLANSVLAPDLESVFLMAGEKFGHISSSLIKQIAKMGGENTAEQLRDFLPEPVIRPLLDKLQKSNA